MTAYLSKIRTLRQTKATCRRLKAEGQRIVFTNGCFDLLHPGHTRYLSAARELGDFLVVGLNSDASVRAIKGPQRPLVDQRSRAEILAALGFVDCVVIFDDDNPLQVIETIVPDVLAKGGDWPEEEIIGSGTVKAAGGEVRRIPYITGFSTSGLIADILRR